MELESGIVVFFVLEPFQWFMVGAHNYLLTINVVAVHAETVNKDEAFTFHCTIASFGVGKDAAAVGDYPLILAIFLLQYCTDGSCTGVGLNDELFFAFIHRIAEEKRRG
uniref:Uncharacterized protein n=1 Tax=Romanomermis culicivorax TaxID=13658 RepID=A0A915I135_ROMCU